MVNARKIQWKNKYSGETGFVKIIRESKRYFENGSVEEARCFRNDSACHKAIDVLNSIGEGDNNYFIITDIDGVAVTM